MHKPKASPLNARILATLIPAILNTGISQADVGSEEWSTVYSSQNYNYNAEFHGIDFIDDHTLLVSGNERKPSSGNMAMGIRYDSRSGNIIDTPPQWIKYEESGSTDNRFWRQIIGSAGNIFFTGLSGGGGAVWKYASDGSLVWKKLPLNLSNTRSGVSDITEDSSGNVFVVGRTYSNGSYLTNNWLINKYLPDGSPASGFPIEFNGDGNGSDTAYRVAIDSHDHVIVAGSVTTTEGAKWLIRNYSNDGQNILWETYIPGGGDSEIPLAILIDENDNIIVGGAAGNAADYDARIVKLAASDGSIVWNQSWDEGKTEIILDMVFDEKGNIYAALRNDDENNNHRIKIQYHDATTGNLLKSQQINHVTTHANTPENESVHTMQIAIQGDQLAVVGYIQDTTNPPTYPRYGYITKLRLMPNVGKEKWQAIYLDSGDSGAKGFNAVDFVDSDTLLASGDKPAISVRYNPETGDILDTPAEWIRYGGSATNDYIYDQVIDQDGSIYMAGRAHPDRPAAWKYDASGNLQAGWPKIFGTYDLGRNYSIAMDDSHIYTAGPYDSDWHINKLSKADGSAATGFPITYDHAGFTDDARAIVVDSEGNFIVAGNVEVDDPVTGNQRDWHVRKYSSDGSLEWEAHYDFKSLNDFVFDMAIDSQDNLIVAGNRNNGTDNDAGADRDWYLVKYAKNGDGNGGAQILWEQSWDDGHHRNGRASTLLVDAQDNIYVGGHQANSNGEYRGLIQYRDGQTGALLKSTKITHPDSADPDNTEHDYVNDLAIDGGRLAVAGATYTYYSPTSYTRKAVLTLLELEHTVSVRVTGGGTVSSMGTPAGIVEMNDCGSDGSCTAEYRAGSDVLLQPAISPDWTSGYWEWSGDCTGDAECNFSAIDQDKLADIAFFCTLIQIQPPAAPINDQPPAWECFDIETTSGGFIVDAGGEVTFRAENSIKLGPGFEVVSGGKFLAVIQ